MLRSLRGDWFLVFPLCLLLLSTLCGAAEESRVYLGSFTSRQHGVEGDLYKLGRTKLRLENFSYDGRGGKKTHFLVGMAGKPSAWGTEIFLVGRTKNNSSKLRKKYRDASCK